MTLELTDWQAWAEFLPHWQKLDRSTRLRHLLEIPTTPAWGPRKPQASRPIPRPLSQGLMQIVRSTCPAAPDALYLMRTLQLLSDPLTGDEALTEWMNGILEPSSLELHTTGYTGGFPGGRLLDLGAVRSWRRLNSFLAIPDTAAGSDWIVNDHKLYTVNVRAVKLRTFGGKAATDAGKAILQALIQSGRPLPVESLVRVAPKANVVRAIFDLIQTGLMAVRWNESCADIEACLLASAPKAVTSLAPPPACPDPEVILPASLPADAVALLTALSAGPLPVKAGDQAELYAKDLKAISARTVEWPKEALDGLYHLPYRLLVTFGFLEMHDCLLVTTRPRPQTSTTLKGQDWLKGSSDQRLKAMLDWLRNATPSHRIWQWKIHYLITRSPMDDDDLDLSDGVRAAFRHLPDTHFVEMAAWLQWAAAAHNPMRAAVPGEFYFVHTRGGTWLRCGTDDATHAATELRSFLTSRLLPLGGVDAGLSPDKKLLIRLNPVGRYYLGYTNEFVAPESTPQGRVVVQPNFDVMFLGENYAAEAALGALCERTPGSGTGVRFRITKAACLKAAHAGWTIDRARDTLTEITGHPLPKNVAAEMAGWFSSRRTYQTEMATLLCLPDAATALAVLSVLRDRVEKLTDTILRLKGAGALSGPEVKRLEKAGIFRDIKKPSADLSQLVKDPDDDDDDAIFGLEEIIRSMMPKARPPARRRRRR